MGLFSREHIHILCTSPKQQRKAAPTLRRRVESHVELIFFPTTEAIIGYIDCGSRPKDR